MMVSKINIIMQTSDILVQTIEIRYGCIGTGYNINIKFSCTRIGYGAVGRKYNDVSEEYDDKNIQNIIDNSKKISSVFNCW